MKKMISGMIIQVHRPRCQKLSLPYPGPNFRIWFQSFCGSSPPLLDFSAHKYLREARQLDREVANEASAVEGFGRENMRGFNSQTLGF